MWGSFKGYEMAHRALANAFFAKNASATLSDTWSALPHLQIFQADYYWAIGAMNPIMWGVAVLKIEKFFPFEC